jgi:hypothetical protein
MPPIQHDLSTLVVQLQDAVARLQALVATLAPTSPLGSATAGAVQITGGGPPAVASAPSTTCGCTAAVGAIGGASAVQQAPQGAFGAPEAKPVERRPRKSKPRDGAAQQREAPSVRAKDFQLPKDNPRTPQEAIDWIRKQVENPSQSWYRKCLNLMAQAYGYSHSGVTYAIDHFRKAPASMKHTDRNPPAGALVFWTTGSRAGHVALSLGNGMVASNDIRGDGKVAIVPMDEIDEKWGADYQGWTPPHFPAAG